VLLGDADREQLFETLKRHAAAGRVGIEELERRVAAITAAQTREQATEVFSDLPPLEAPPPAAAARRPWGRGRGHAEADKPAPEWRPTNERFRDPKTNRVMRVWVDAAGGRHYVGDS
jgi:Domain of unknown function (DUF1707)